MSLSKGPLLIAPFFCLVDYPLGTSNWTLYNDKDTAEGKSYVLSFTACDDNEFNCDDGICIEMDHR